MGVASHHLCHIMFARSRSQVLLTLKGRGLYKYTGVHFREERLPFAFLFPFHDFAYIRYLPSVFCTTYQCQDCLMGKKKPNKWNRQSMLWKRWRRETDAMCSRTGEWACWGWRSLLWWNDLEVLGVGSSIYKVCSIIISLLRFFVCFLVYETGLGD